MRKLNKKLSFNNKNILYKNKKAVSIIVAITLLLIVTVVAGIGFNTWYKQYSSQKLTQTEVLAGGFFGKTQIDKIVGNTLYIKNPNKNITILSVKVEGINCSISGTYTDELVKIPLPLICTNGIKTDKPEVIITTNNDLITQKAEFVYIPPSYLPCTLDGITITGDGSSRRFYNTQTVPNGDTCLWIMRTCNNGTLSGDINYQYKSCSVEAPIIPVVSTFISVWDTTESGVSANNQIALPLEADGTYNFIVTGSTLVGTPVAINTHTNNVLTFDSPGVHEINITGTIKGWRFNNGGDKYKLSEIKAWGPLNVGNNGAYFAGCENFDFTGSDALDLTGTTNLSEMFLYSYIFNGYINNWDVSEVTDTSSMFQYDASFNQSLNNWNVSLVTDMHWMFIDVNSFNQPLNNWDTSSVTNMSGMFNYATSFNQPLDNWDTSSVITMDWMFDGASSFNQSLNNWNVSSVTNMYRMFSGADSFNQPLNNWDTSSVKDMSIMFNAASFNQPLDNWNTNSVKDMSFMFGDSFNQPLNNWNTSSVTSMYGMFWGANSFNQPLNNWDTSSVTSMGYMFNEATSFNQPLYSWNTSKVTNMGSMFRNANSFNQDLRSWCVPLIATQPSNFATSSPLDTNGLKPVWSTCPAQITHLKTEYECKFKDNKTGCEDYYIVKEIDGIDVVHDTLHGLYWEQNPSNTEVNLANAKVYCTGLGSGWRLPTLVEMEVSIVDLSRNSTPLIIGGTNLTLFNGVKKINGWYWTNSRWDSSFGYLVSFDIGRSYELNIASTEYVLCVKNENPFYSFFWKNTQSHIYSGGIGQIREISDFSINNTICGGSGTIHDSFTNLCWELAPTTTTRNWLNSNLYCDSLSIANGNWRAPDKAELMTLLYHNGVSTTYTKLNSLGFIGIQNGAYWSNTKSTSNPSSYAYHIVFDSGTSYYHSVNDNIYMICVKDPSS